MKAAATRKGYGDAISQATGVEAPVRLAMIEEQMRAENGGVLDHLTPRRFASEAVIADMVIDEMEQHYPEIFAIAVKNAEIVAHHYVALPVSK